MPASAAASEAAFPPSPEYPKSDTTSPKRVLLRRPLQAVPSTSEIPSDGDSAFGGSPTTERRKVLLAHKIKPGQTIQLKASKATATMRDDPDTQTDIHAESLVHAASRPIGPQYGAEGNLLSFSVLGPVEEFAEQSEGLIGGSPAMAGTSTLRGPIGSTASHVFDRLDESFENARLKNDSASARQRQSEALAEQQVRTWNHQISTLADRLGVPQSSLQMARTAEYRGRVQQREVLEALRRRQHPYGGDRAWQIGLRAGGVFYEAIGNASNGIFCPFRAPNDVEALARAGTLAAQIDENDLTLAALESKILGEQRAAKTAAEGGGETAGEEDGLGGTAEPTGTVDDDDDFIDPEGFDVVSTEHLNEIARLRDKYNIEGAAPAHLSGDQRVLWGIFKEIDTDESGEVSKQELYAAFAKMGLVASAAEMLRLFREGDLDGNGRIDCDEFITLGQKVDVFAGAADAFASKNDPVKKNRRKSTKIAINKGSQLGPILSIGPDHLGFEVGIGELAEKTIAMVNSGSTAMYYEWERVPVSAGLGSTTVVDAATQFFAQSAKGCILPDTTVDMRFTFLPTKPGIFQEEWRLKLTPPTKDGTPPVMLRGVCLAAPERQHQVRVLDAELQRRKVWNAVQDILDREILPRVYKTTIPDGVRIDAILAPLVDPSTPRPEEPPAAEEPTAAEVRFAAFIACYGERQALPPTAAIKCFETLDEIAAATPVSAPAPDKQMAYERDVTAAMRDAVTQMLESFVVQAVAAEKASPP